MSDSRPTAQQPHVYIVVLNWNGWQDTIKCLESVFRLEYPSFTAVVCDNASSDGSIEKIQDWARGNRLAECDSPDLLRLIDPPYPKPIRCIAIDAAELTTTKSWQEEVPLVLIQTGANLGFAGGSNVGIRYALAREHRDYVWLLNNDTVIEPDSLAALVQMAQNDPGLGICGSLLRNYIAPHDIQTLGRKYKPWSGRTTAYLELSTRDSIAPSKRGYIVEGASMLISGKFLRSVGLLEESYFLFFEELDWITRAAPAFHFGYSPASVVYHKTGASIGSAIARSSRSALSDFYQARNRLVFTRRFYPWFFPTVLMAVFLSALHRVWVGRRENAFAILRGAIASLSSTRSKGQAFC